MRADRDSDWPCRLLRKLRVVPLVDEGWLTRIGSQPTAAAGRPLTPRELAALEALSRGLTYQMAADVLGVSADTVKDHLRHARYKLQAKNTTHACCEALRRGLIS